MDNDKPSVKADDLMRVEGAINDRIAKIDRVKEEIQPQKEMLDSIFDNDLAYAEHSQAAKKANQLKAQIKKQILNRPEAKAVSEKIKILKDELKEHQDALSYHLREFQRMTGANEFEGEDGELREIVPVYKLVKKRELKK
ncbi:MAG: hypothetical protein HY044_00300 [Candidatus Woesebacteria bacterium]|nr:MAG: hypothetical protein HY044_00300 [Candidatus Woesebacteria bacterium]